MIAYDTLSVVPLLAASVVSFRKENLLTVTTPQAVEAVLADLSSLPAVPLLQLALEKDGHGAINAGAQRANGRAK